MTNTKTHDIEATLAQIIELEQAGCELVRSAVPDECAAEALPEIISKSSAPLIADIHFRADLAVKAIEAGAAKVRINPGNIGTPEQIKKVIDAAKAHHTPVRIGVNSGSLEKDILEKHGSPTAEALCESTFRHIEYFEQNGFQDLVLSVKSASVETCIQANRILSERTDHPLHIGITEAGTRAYGTVKSAIGLGALLMQGIGDTIRVSLSGDPVNEVQAARHILKASGARLFGPEVITCPTCGRTKMDMEKIALEIEEKTASFPRPVTIAVMGCEVNGPGEAREADIGVACGKTNAVLFVKGEEIRNIEADRIVEELLAEINKRFL
jgi:(E)-4-hydroxy-3-methylbut-2-enyl-diphosphate synthase